MQLFCPACQAAFAGSQRCPRCGGLLLLPHEATDTAAPVPLDAPTRTQQPSPANRVVLGCLLALGMYLGLRKLALGMVLAIHSDPDSWWTSFEGLAASCGLQIAAIVFGAIVAAAGRTFGLAFGAAVGGLCGTAFLGAELFAGAPAQDLVLYVQPLLLIAAGGIAGVLAARIWRALPKLDIPDLKSSRLSSSRFFEVKNECKGRGTSWLRIAAGAMVMIFAIAVADKIRFNMQKYSAGMLRVNSVGQGQFLTWQLGVLGLVAGGVIAGAGTGAGIRHGAIAAIFGSIGIIAATAVQGETFAPILYWLQLLSLGSAPGDPATLVAVAAGVLFVGAVGGWLGSTLFLPLAPEHMLKRLTTTTD